MAHRASIRPERFLKVSAMHFPTSSAESPPKGTVRASLNISSPILWRSMSGLPTLPVNLCPLSGGAEFARFAHNLGEPVGKAVEASAGVTMRQHAAEHLEHVLSRQQGINYSLESSSNAGGRHFRLWNEMPWS